MNSNTSTYLEKKNFLFVILGIFFITNVILAELIGSKLFSLEKTLGFSSFDISILGVEHLAFNLTAGTQYVKFFYDKSNGNIAFDDFCALDGPVGIFGMAKNNLAVSVYPNPSNGLVNIKTSTFQSKGLTVVASNVLGKEVKRVVLNNPASQYQVNLNDLDAGIYMIRVQSEFGESTQRVVIKK